MNAATLRARMERLTRWDVVDTAEVQTFPDGRFISHAEVLAVLDEFANAGKGNPPPSDDEFRPGLPAEALRKAWQEWSDLDGDRVVFLGDDRDGSAIGSAIGSATGFRPYLSTWSAVERLAAKSA